MFYTCLDIFKLWPYFPSVYLPFDVKTHFSVSWFLYKKYLMKDQNYFKVILGVFSPRNF